MSHFLTIVAIVGISADSNGGEAEGSRFVTVTNIQRKIVL
jgi:hypothetical protein